jgi:hypothetical protein
MATIAGEITFTTRWLLDLDVQDIAITVNNAIKAPQGAGTVFFLGETHKIGFDLDRRAAVYQQFVGDERVTILLERGMPLLRRGNVVQESNAYPSGDDTRNTQAASYLKEELDVSGYARPILIFFGQEHEARLKALITQTYPAQARLRWVSIPSMGDHVAKEPTHAFDPSGKVPAGFVPCDQTRLDHRLGLLKKGIVREPFNLELVRADGVFEALVWAVYFQDAALNARLRNEVSSEGTTEANFVRMNGVNAAFARLFLRPKIAQVDNGTLSTADFRNDYF